MERRSLLRQLLSLGSRNLVRLAGDNCLRSSGQHEVKAICHALSSLYDRKISARNWKGRAASIASHALSPLHGENGQLLGTSTQSKSIQQYEIAKIGRREFLVIGGVVMALAVGNILYYVNPAFRTLTKTVTQTLTQTESALIRTTESSRTVSTTSSTSRTVETASSTYRMTVSTIWYSRVVRTGRGYDMHFKTARPGKIMDVRRELESKGAEYFQKTVYHQFGRRVPKSKIRIGFEREEPTTEAQNNITVEARYMEYHGGRWKSTAMPSRSLRW